MSDMPYSLSLGGCGVVWPCPPTYCITADKWPILTWPIRARFNREPPVLSHVQYTLSVRMAAHLNQNNGALRHSWWDILIYVIWAYPSSGSLFSDEEVHGSACQCPLNLRSDRADTPTCLFHYQQSHLIIVLRPWPQAERRKFTFVLSSDYNLKQTDNILNHESFLEFILHVHASDVIPLNFDSLICAKSHTGWMRGYKYFGQVCVGLMPLTL